MQDYLNSMNYVDGRMIRGHRSKTSEVRDWRSETGDQRLEIRDWRSETEDQRLEFRDWRSETGDQRLEIRDWRSETRGRRLDQEGLNGISV
jgi:hypothetical protein